MARVISQALDEAGNVFLLKDDGTLTKLDSLANVLWSVQTRQEPTLGNFVYANQIALDIDGDVWLAYADQLNAQLRHGTDGSFSAEVLSSVSSVLVPQAGGLRMFALSPLLGIFYEIDVTSATLVRNFDLTVQIPDYVKGIFATEMGSTPTGKIWFPALVGPVGQDKQAVMARFDPAGNGVFNIYPVSGDLNVPIIAVSSDVNGKVYGATLHGSVFRFNDTTLVYQFDAMYDPQGQAGVIDIVSFDDSDDPILVDDGTFAFAGSVTRTINPGDGTTISTVPSSNVGTITGDITGYHHRKLTRINVTPAPIVPVINTGLLTVYVKADGTVTFTGAPGYASLTTSIEAKINAGPVIVATVAPNADGSFSVTSAPGVGNPSGEAVTVTAANGAQNVVQHATSVPRTLPSGFTVDFKTNGFVMAGVPARLKAKILDSGGADVPSGGSTQPIFRVKRDSDGKWFDGTSFVADNGDYLVPTYDATGAFWFKDMTFPADVAGALSFIIKDSPPYTVDLLLIPEIAKQADLEAVLTLVTELNARVDIAFGAPAGEFTDPNTIGGFILERLNDIQKVTHRLLRGIVGTMNVEVESILTDVDRQEVPKGSTPAIAITIYDKDRRFPIDISGAKVYFRAKVNLASPVLIINTLADITDGPGGMARAKLTSVDTGTAQRLQAQIVCDIPGTGTLVSPPFIFDVTNSVL